MTRSKTFSESVLLRPSLPCQSYFIYVVGRGIRVFTYLTSSSLYGMTLKFSFLKDENWVNKKCPITLIAMIRIKNTKITTITIKSDFSQYESKAFLLKIFVTNLINKVPLKLSKVLSICKK